MNLRDKGLFAIASNPLVAVFTEPVATCLTCDPTFAVKDSGHLRVPQPAVMRLFLIGFQDRGLERGSNPRHIDSKSIALPIELSNVDAVESNQPMSPDTPVYHNWTLAAYGRTTLSGLYRTSVL